MKIRTVSLASLAAVFALPAFANGPMPGDPGMSSSAPKNTSPGRQQWTKKRIKHLKQQMSDHKKARQWSDNLGYATGEYVPQLHRNAAEQRKHLINLYEFLALKAERGKATAKDIAQMRALQQYLLSTR